MTISKGAQHYHLTLGTKEQGILLNYQTTGIVILGGDKPTMTRLTIAKHLDGSHDSINRFVLNPNPIKQKKKTGPAPKLNSRARRSVTRVASNSMKSCNDINQELNLRVSKWTVWRALKENPNITRAVMRPAPRLTNVHKARRLDFARRNMSTNWEKLQ
uniref:HTH_Tnp_Tc3_2 domain-containing protein n=1 Tax=Caenorhabditis japonica TaxID=281687 RepID=A0A8R1E6S6_CAEJA